MESHPQVLPTHKRERRRVSTNQKFALHVGLDSEQIRQSNILLFFKKSLQSRINLLEKFMFIVLLLLCCFVVVVVLFCLFCCFQE